MGWGFNGTGTAAAACKVGTERSSALVDLKVHVVTDSDTRLSRAQCSVRLS